RPSLEALIPKLLSPELMPAVAALRSVGGTIGGIVGPALGGVLAATIGPALAYSIDFSTFAISLFALWSMRATPPPLSADRPSMAAHRSVFFMPLHRWARCWLRLLPAGRRALTCMVLP